MSLVGAHNRSLDDHVGLDASVECEEILNYSDDRRPVEAFAVSLCHLAANGERLKIDCITLIIGGSGQSHAQNFNQFLF